MISLNKEYLDIMAFHMAILRLTNFEMTIIENEQDRRRWV